MRKKLYMLLAVLVAVSVVAGCGGGAPAASTPTTAATAAPAATTAAATTVAATTAADAGSAEATTAATTAAGTSAAAATTVATVSDEPPVEMTVIAPLFSDPPDMAGPYWTEWMTRTNSKLDVEWVPSGDYGVKMNLKLASGALPEMLVIEGMSPQAINAIKGGAFWPLGDFLGDMSAYPNLRDNLTPGAYKHTTYDGMIWGIPRSRNQIGNGFKLRKDWLDELGLPVPTTLDEYTEAMRQVVAADPAGSGTIGYICVGPPSTWYDNLKECFGYSDIQLDANGGLLPPYMSDNYFDFLEYARTLYADGLLADEFIALKNQSGMDLFTTGQGFSYCRDMWWDFQWEKSMRETQPDAEIINVVLDGPKDNNVCLTTGVNGGMYINSQVPEEKALRIMDYFEATATVEMTDLAFYGVEGVHHTVQDGAKTLNDFGVSEITATSIVLGGLDYKAESLLWGKVDSASAPRDYNLAKRATCENYTEIGDINIFGALKSETWASEWPKYTEEFQSLETKAVTGQITVDEVRQYVEELKADPGMQKAFVELAASYENFK